MKTACVGWGRGGGGSIRAVAAFRVYQPLFGANHMPASSNAQLNAWADNRARVIAGGV
jgi:hypothetical protein